MCKGSSSWPGAAEAGQVGNSGQVSLSKNRDRWSRIDPASHPVCRAGPAAASMLHVSLSGVDVACCS